MRWHYILFILCSMLAAVITPVRTLAAEPAAHTILVLGDSLSAEYGLSRGSGWVALLDKKLAARKPPSRMVNASISGDTTAGGLSRLPAALERHRPDILIIELGSNDALRGLPLASTRANLNAMIELAQGAGARVLLLGMQIPPNYGQAYSREFSQIYTDLAARHGTALVPFLLEGMALNRELFQDDAIHPNEQAQAILARNVWKQLEVMVDAPGGS